MKHLSVVTERDIKNYFKGDDWRLFPYKDEIKASGDYVDVILKPMKVIFNIKIENIDDPVDSEEGETEDPIKFIVKYLQTGTEGDEIFRKMASNPQGVSYILVSLATDYETNKISSKTLTQSINNILSVMSHKADSYNIPKDIQTLFDYSAEDTYKDNDDSAIRNKQPDIKLDQSQRELDEIVSKMNSKGWDAKLDESEIIVNISDFFIASITINKIIWNYEFVVRDFDDTRVSGQTEDPIAEFRRYYQNPEVKAMYNEARRQHEEEQEYATVGPSSV